MREGWVLKGGVIIRVDEGVRYVMCVRVVGLRGTVKVFFLYICVYIYIFRRYFMCVLYV